MGVYERHGCTLWNVITMDFKKSSICDSVPVALSEVRLVWCGQ